MCQPLCRICQVLLVYTTSLRASHASPFVDNVKVLVPSLPWKGLADSMVVVGQSKMCEVSLLLFYFVGFQVGSCWGLLSLIPNSPVVATRKISLATKNTCPIFRLAPWRPGHAKEQGTTKMAVSAAANEAARCKSAKAAPAINQTTMTDSLPDPRKRRIRSMAL